MHLLKPQKLFFLCFFIFLQSFAWSATTPVDPAPNKKVTATALQDIRNYSNKQLEKMIGRKLLLKEKVVLYTYRLVHPIDDPKEKANSNARTGLVMSILGILVLPVILSIVGLILSRKALAVERKTPGTLTKKTKSQATTGVILGIIGILLGLLFILLIVALSGFYG
jgi:hypothetical protein